MSLLLTFRRPRFRQTAPSERAAIIPFPGATPEERIGGKHLLGPEREGLQFAATAWQRFRGLKPYGSWRGVLVLLPCWDVHTCGMKGPIDIAFADRHGRVLASYRDVKPWKRKRCRGAMLTLERWSDADAPWFTEGSWISLCEREGKLR